MKLEELIKSLDELDDDLLIFQKDSRALDADVILLEFVPQEIEEATPDALRVIDNQNYHYLIEISTAKEILQPWLESLPSRPSDRAIAERLFHYAIYDA